MDFETDSHTKNKRAALNALNELKSKLYLYPSVTGVGLGKNSRNDFIITVYVNDEAYEAAIKGKQSIPKLLYIEDPLDKKKTVRIPTKIEPTDRVELMAEY